MDLATWLASRELTDAAFAKKVGCNQTTINRARRGVTFPDPGLLLKIVEATDGEVQVSDLLTVHAAQRALPDQVVVA